MIDSRDHDPIERYWDYCATTPLSPEVIREMSDSLARDYANPSSAHLWGLAARDRIEDARLSLAKLLGVQARELFFTGGATESNQIAILGTHARVSQPGHIITQATEHSAVLGPFRALERRGFEITVLPVDSSGRIDVNQLKSLINERTQLISIMHINNEIGTTHPIGEIADLIAQTASPDCLFHVDGAQSTGKISIDLSALGVDLFSLSAHKFYGPKGIGALYVRRRSPRRPSLKLPPISFGGDQERGLRPGTLATHQIIGLGVAAEEAHADLSSGGTDALTEKVSLLWAGLRSLDPLAIRRGSGEAPHILSVTLSPQILERIEEHWAHIAFSRGSACHSQRGQPSPILTALGLSAEEASRTCRFGLGRFTTIAEIEEELTLLSRL